MKILVLTLFKVFLKIIYTPMKLLKSKKQVVFLSRQCDEKSLDMLLLEKAMESECPDVKRVFRLRTLGGGAGAKIGYFFGLIGDMYYLATSQVAVLDTYSLTVSCLKHKKELTVIQMWHALGALKKFGLQSVGTKEGRDEAMSKALNMHRNYDVVLAPSKKTAEFYMQGFGVGEDKITILPLPRVDEICSGETKSADFYSQNPGFSNKKIILYVPTFRSREAYITEMLKTALEDSEDYSLLISNHPLFGVKQDEKYLPTGDFSSIDLMKLADVIITDYSACAFEAALLMKPLYFFVPDLEEYSVERGLNIDLKAELPGAVYEDADELAAAVEAGSYDLNALYAFRVKYIEGAGTQNAAELARLIKQYVQ